MHQSALEQHRVAVGTDTTGTVTDVPVLAPHQLTLPQLVAPGVCGARATAAQLHGVLVAVGRRRAHHHAESLLLCLLRLLCAAPARCGLRHITPACGELSLALKLLIENLHECGTKVHGVGVAAALQPQLESEQGVLRVCEALPTLRISAASPVHASAGWRGPLLLQRARAGRAAPVATTALL